jgi:hypothetical protein
LYNVNVSKAVIKFANPPYILKQFALYICFNEVWCDMTTDVGGYMLVGKANSSVTWTVPSSDRSLQPYGDPQWASNLGDAPILDFRIQVSKAEDLSKTSAHW